MTTYLLKLGPEHIRFTGSAMDRRIADSLPALALRLRLEDMATLIADALQPLLAANGAPIHFLNIAGGPAMDSLNALLMLRKANRPSLAGRRISVQVLDGDVHGPAFGARALEALRAVGGPLDGVDASFRRLDYDWSQPATLAERIAPLAAQAIVICSSEGGLFEYGSDEEIVGNLQALGAVTPHVVATVGSVTRDDAAIRRLREQPGAATRPRGLAKLRPLVDRAGWQLERAIERPFSDHVVLRPLR
jgi:hypothetical protein